MCGVVLLLEVWICVWGSNREIDVRRQRVWYRGVHCKSLGQEVGGGELARGMQYVGRMGQGLMW